MDVFAGRYRIEGSLGAGGLGKVYRAFDLTMNAPVALKLLDAGEELLAVVEASALKALSSDHILPVLNAGVHNDVPFVVTEIATGGTAEGRLTDSPYGLDPVLAIRWTRQILTGLDYCHRRGVLHRDVTTRNIFLDNNDHARLGDFGAAANLSDDGTAARHGNQRVVAPEGLETGRLTTRSDVYSVGVSLWRMLTGSWPYEADTEAKLLAAIRNERRTPLPRLAPHLSRSLTTAAVQALRPEPNDRYQDCGAFRAALADSRLPARGWMPTPPHDGHDRCYLGSFPAGPVNLCVTIGGRSATVETVRVDTRRHIGAGCLSVPRQSLHSTVRRLFRDL